MIRQVILIITLFSSLNLTGQAISGRDLLNKSIAYHDPNGKWAELEATFELEQTRPNGNGRMSTFNLSNPQSYFQVTDDIDGHRIVKTISGNKGEVTFDGSSEIDEAYKAKYRLSNEGTVRTRNYYVYLYGLPMKLKDPGTNVASEVSTASFNEKEYLELKVTYDQEVGTDDWFFYMDPETYAMEGYKFYHQNGNGEFITLEGMETFQGLKLPKLRKWYTTNDSTFLGADNIISIGPFNR